MGKEKPPKPPEEAGAPKPDGSVVVGAAAKPNVEKGVEAEVKGVDVTANVADVAAGAPNTGVPNVVLAGVAAAAMPNAFVVAGVPNMFDVLGAGVLVAGGAPPKPPDEDPKPPEEGAAPKLKPLAAEVEVVGAPKPPDEPKLLEAGAADVGAPNGLLPAELGAPKLRPPFVDELPRLKPEAAGAAG